MSRVVHLRTSNKNIAACYQILEQRGFNTNIPMSTAVHKVLSAVIDGQIREGEIPEINEVIAAQKLIEYLNLDEEIDLQIFKGPLVFDSEDSEEEFTGVNVDGLDQDAIAAAVDHMKSGGIRAAAPDDLPEVPIDAPPWEEFDMLNYDDLKVAYPKDVMVERAVDVPILQRAIEVVYKAIPNTRWHEPKTMDMVNRLATSFDVWRAENKSGD